MFNRKKKKKEETRQRTNFIFIKVLKALEKAITIFIRKGRQESYRKRIRVYDFRTLL